MKILFVIAALRNGGAERVLSIVSSELAKDNEVYIAVLEENLGLYEFNSNIKFIYPKIYGSSRLLSKIKKIFALRKCFKEINPDVIISFIDWTNVACVAANLGLGYKHIATEHHANEYLTSAKFRLIRDLAYKRVDMLSVLSKSDFEYYNFVKNRTILHNPCFLASPIYCKKENIILSVGRLEKVKGYDVYLDALKKVPKELLNGWRIVIAGDGSLRGKLEQKAKEYGLEVEFLGHVNDVAPLYEKAKIFVISSRSEGLSNVLIEAANFNCARISSDTVGAKELIRNGIDGLIFENQNKDDLAFMLEEILNDDNLRKKIAQNAKDKADEFSVANIMKKWRKVIEETVKQ
ncbi:glycosyltransferase [Campylobacter sp. RM13119]|uniref:glycosyltransferase n=1 Tax=Campylobacter californiensis TaxID=1032243 RepID=UPI00147451E4|nr:glycosyltransferase [Campylobacter sp. RM13119]MBE3606838.1 glycosyltransferase [Campylobacter sp. RM13119]